MAGRRSSYREGLAFSGLSFATTALLGIVSSIAIARAYGADTLGEFALAMAPTNAAWFLSTIKERPGFIRELAFLEPGAPRVSALFWAVFAFSFVLTAVVGGLILLVTYFVYKGPIGHPELFTPAVVNMLVYLFITNTCFNIDTVLSGFRAGKPLFHLRQHQALVFLGVGVALGYAWGTLWGLVVATAASWATSLIHRLFVARGYLSLRVPREELRAGMETLRDIVRFGLRVAPGGFADGISNETGTWVLGVVSPISAVGGYNRAWTLGRRFMELNWRISEMLFPTLVERRAKQDREGFDRALIDTIRYCAIGMLWLAAAVGGAADGVMKLFGSDFQAVAPALAVIMLMPAVSTISSLQRHAVMSLDRPTATSVSAGLRMVVTIIASIGLTLAIGTTGTAAAVILGFLADVAFMFALTRPALTVPVTTWWPVREMVALALAYAAGLLAAWGVYAAWSTILGLLLAMAAGSVAYWGLFLITGGISTRDHERFGQIRDRLRARRAPVSGTASS